MEDLITKLTGRASERMPDFVSNAARIPLGDQNSSGGLFQSNNSDLPIGDRAYEAYGSVGTLFAIVTQLANAFATVEWHLFKKSAQQEKARRKEVMSHGFLDVWNRPNPFYTGRYFRECCQQHLDLVGETVIVLYMVGNLVIEMWPVRPDRIRPVKHPTKFLTGYVYIGPNGEEVPLELNQVIHIKYPNPADPYRGMGPVQTILNDIDAAKFSAQWNRNFFINGAQPGGVIKVDYRMTDPEWKEFLQRWNAQHRGVANAHRVAVLERAEWQDTKFSMEDMQFVELRNLPREILREAFAFPKPMLGTVDDVNRANSDAAKEILAEGHTIPRLSRWKDTIDNFLLPKFANGDKHELEYEDPTPVNHEAADRERNSQWTAAKNGITAGYHPDDVAEAVGLPKMRWVGIPTTTSKSVVEQTEEEGGNEDA